MVFYNYQNYQLGSASYIIQQLRLRMGNSGSDSASNPFYASEGGKDSELTQLLQEFTFVSIYEDELFNRCSVIEHKETKQLIIAKEVICETEQEMSKLYEEFERRKANLTSPNLLRLRYTIKKKTEGLFSDEYKLILFFDYVVTNLYSQYRNRVKTGKHFTNDQINIITCGALRGYAALEAQNIPNSKVRLTNIYFGLSAGMPLPKVIDSKLFPTATNVMQVKKGQHYQDVFLAPQELRTIGDFGSNLSKAGVWSLAVSIIQLCLLNPCINIYDYSKKSINYTELDNRLNIVKNKYPLSIYCLLRDMLERNQDSRPSFSKLAQGLPNNLKNLPNTMNISLMKGETKILSGNQGVSQFNSNGFSKVLNPLNNTRTSKRLTGTLVSQYRPNVETSEVYTNGNRYEGEKRDGLRHGRGKYIYNDGSYYFGDWVKGKMQGEGQLVDADGNIVYEGQWKDDHYEGKGKLNGRGTDWIKYEGEFRGGRMQGFGQILFKDGKRYKGQFINDVPHGKGRMFLKNNQVQNGIWEKGNYISQF